MSLTNWIVNPSFETNITGWTAIGGTQARTTAVAEPGKLPWALAVTADGSGPAGSQVTVSGLDVNTNYVFSCYVKINAASAFSVIPSVSGMDSTVVSRPALINNNYFVRRWVGFKTTSTSHTLQITSEVTPAIGDIIYIDMCQVTRGTLAPYFDGSYPYCSWTGTDNASTSSISVLTAGQVTTEEIVVANGICLNTYAWNITSKDGRYTLPSFRGDDYTSPDTDGQMFAINKPVDSATWALSMFIVGSDPGGKVPYPGEQRRVFQDNFETLIQHLLVNSYTITIYTWQPDGSVRMGLATLIGSSGMDATTMMAGRRAEITFAFKILSGTWHDYFNTTVTGAAGTHWSNDDLVMSSLAGGTAAMNDAVITVTGPINNPSIHCAKTSTTVSLVGSVPTGQSWVIDCGAFTSTLNGASVVANTTHTGSSRFLLISPGNESLNPTITLSGTGTAAATNISVSVQRRHYFA